MDSYGNFFATSLSSAVPAPRWKRTLDTTPSTPVSNTPASVSRGPRKTPTRRAAGSAAKAARLASSSSKRDAADRFIPRRGASAPSLASATAAVEKIVNTASTKLSPAEEARKASDAAYIETLEMNMALQRPSEHKILTLREKAPEPALGYQSSLKVLYTQNKAEQGRRMSRPQRFIPQMPSRVLDAPDVVDDYYMNVLDWGASNSLAVGLGSQVYLWAAASGKVSHLADLDDGDHVTSVRWLADGQHLAVGTNSAEVHIWNVKSERRLQVLKHHQARVCALAPMQHILTSGARDGSMVNWDVRMAPGRNVVCEYRNGHEEEVCGLEWSRDGTQLASGGNDNQLLVWNAADHGARPAHRLTDHTAAVKAIAWCPWQANLLASGGGSADRHLRFWNTQNGRCVNSVDTESQVCGIRWSTKYRELVSSHGYAKNQLCVWNYPSLVKTAELYGHKSRVLHMTISPDGRTVATAAADESLRLWDIFDPSGDADGAKPAVAKTVTDPARRMNRHAGSRLR